MDQRKKAKNFEKICLGEFCLIKKNITDKLKITMRIDTNNLKKIIKNEFVNTRLQFSTL